MIGFQCQTCGEFHEGIASFAWDWPIQYLDVPEQERDLRCKLTSDTCTIDDKHHFVRGCLEVAVKNVSEPLVWGVWVSLSERSFRRFVELYRVGKREQEEAFFGWLCSHIRIYPDTLNLRTMIRLRDGGLRPSVQLEPTDHPLAIEQREGITMERVSEIYKAMVHAEGPAV